MAGSKFALVPLAQLTSGPNVRRDVGDLDSLAVSIRANGILEPLVGCPSEDGATVEILMGQRRLAACMRIGYDPVPCILRPRPSDRDRVLLQIAENLERRDMNPIDEAFAFLALQARKMTGRQIGDAVQRSQGHVSRRLKLLTFPDCVIDAIADDRVSASTALAVPLALFEKSTAVDRLAKALILGGDKELRTWALSEGRAVRGSGDSRRGAEKMRNVDVEADAFALAKRFARLAGKPIRTWVSEAIREKAGL